MQKEKREKLLQSAYEEKRNEVNDLKYYIETDQIELDDSQKKESERKICAMEVLVEENTWVRLKNARDYT